MRSPLIRLLVLPLALMFATVQTAPASGSAHRHKHPRRSAKTVKASPAYGLSPEVLRFAAEVVERRGLPRDWLVAELAQAKRIEVVRKLVMPAPVGSPKNWAAYRARFIEPQRVEAGTVFWRAHESWLAQAEARYGVPAEIIVAIIGVETFYGRVTGDFRTLDALATLSFDFPQGRKDRSAFFRSELEEFLVLCSREGLDPQAVKGSFAGAVGLPQFMPSSLNHKAVDLDGDGHIDLKTSVADAVGSVANYLAQAGWQRGMATHHAVQAPEDPRERAELLAPDILPSFTAAQFAQHGAALDTAGRAHLGLLALVELQNGSQVPSYVAGTQNFYAITRYNWSAYYAMAVIELAHALVQQRAAVFNASPAAVPAAAASASGVP